MKKLSTRTLSALLLLACTSFAYAQGRPQVVNVPLSRPGEPIALQIDIPRARIEVIGEDREDALFEVSVAGGQRKIITPSGAQTIEGSSYTFEIDEDDNEISFVPSEATVEQDEDGNGVAIRIENVIVAKINGGGPVLRLKSLHGDIHIREVQ